MWVQREFKIDACHWLPDYKGKCANVHGHTWKIKLNVEGPVQANGMVMDFGEFKTFISRIEEQFDHRTINDHLSQPTAERMALFILQRLVDYLPFVCEHWRDAAVMVQEGDGGTAITSTKDLNDE